jgi:DNA polymerase-3 subunit beta
MNLTIERAPALSALSRVFDVVERRHTIEILSNFVLTADDGHLTVCGSDLNMWATERFPAQVAGEGAIAVPADKLHDIVRNADTGAQVALSLDAADPRLKVKSGRSNFKLPCLPAKDFPRSKDTDFSEPFSMPAKQLADMMARVSWSVSRESNAKAIENLYLANVGGLLHAVGCAGVAVALRRETAPAGSEGLKAMLPMKLVSHLIKWLGDAEGEVRVSWLDRNPDSGRPNDALRFECGEGQLTARLFDATGFVNYPAMLSEEADLMARTDQDALKTAIRRVLIMKDVKSDTIRLTFTPGAVTLAMRNDQAGEGAEEVACDYEGPEATVLVGARQLGDTLASLQGDRVELGFHPHTLTNRDPDYLKSIRVIVRAPCDPQYLSVLAQMVA